MVKKKDRRLDPRPHSQGWVQDATLYIPPTSTVSEVYLKPEWRELDLRKLEKALGLK